VHGPKWTVVAKELPQHGGRRPAQNLKNNWNRLVGESGRKQQQQRETTEDSDSALSQGSRSSGGPAAASSPQQRGKEPAPVSHCVSHHPSAGPWLSQRQSPLCAGRSRRVGKEKRPLEAPGWNEGRRGASAPSSSPHTPHASSSEAGQKAKKQRTSSHEATSPQGAGVARGSGQSGKALHWAASHSAIAIRENGSVRSFCSCLSCNCCLSRLPFALLPVLALPVASTVAATD
jgi:hypothetical protein